MFIYILKSTTCLAVLYLFYRLFLENENMHFFKRFYLIGTLFVSFFIPLITFTTYGNVTETASPIALINNNEEESNSFLFSEIFPIMIWTIYFIGVLFFSIRFFKNLISIVLRIKKNPKLNIQSHINVLLQKKVIPHTFLKYIFLNKVDFESKNIPHEVLLHEQTHAIQRHSIDILFTEILQILFWFNPLIYLVKNSIKLNHEFLADQAVLSKGINPSQYQKTLLLFSTKTASPILANSINYSIIRKRFTVMKTKTSMNKIWFKGLLILPLLAILIFSFSTKEDIEINEANPLNIVIQEGASKAQINEYNKLARHYNAKDQSNMIIKKPDLERLMYLYSLMSDSQLKKVESFPNFPPPPTPDKAIEPMRVEMGVNDKDSNAPPPPPKTIKVIKGVNDTASNIPPPPPKKSN
jgi:beta-lactamase regulating signal transducer with metallopeptidase domain